MVGGKAVVALVVSTALIGAGAAPAGAASTRAEYIAQADPICQSTMNAETAPARAFRRLFDKGRYKAAGKMLRKEFAAFAAGVEQLATLTPPSADSQLISGWVQMLRAQVPLGGRGASAISHGHIHSKVLAQLGALNVNTQALVASFGFQRCQQL